MSAGDGDFGGVDWSALPGRHPANMNELVDGWIAIAIAAGKMRGTEPLEAWVRVPTNHLVDQHPDLTLALVMALLAQPVPDTTKFGIAAVVLGDLLSCHGSAFIGEVERLAGGDARFRQTVCRLSRGGMAADIWSRALAARGDIAERGDFAGVDWGHFPPDRLPLYVDELVDGWIANDVQTGAVPMDQKLDDDAPHFWAWQAANYLAQKHPAKAMAFITAMLTRPVTDDTRFSLAAGPLEDVLAYHGPRIIDEVERLARQDAVFRDTLQGVWKNAMTDDIWRRVVAARGTEASP